MVIIVGHYLNSDATCHTGFSDIRTIHHMIELFECAADTVLIQGRKWWRRTSEGCESWTGGKNLERALA